MAGLGEDFCFYVEPIQIDGTEVHVGIGESSARGERAVLMVPDTAAELTVAQLDSLMLVLTDCRDAMSEDER